MTPLEVLLVSPWSTEPGASGVVSACRHLVEGLALDPGMCQIVVLSLGAERRSDSICEGAVRVETLPRQARFALATNGWPDYRRAERWLGETDFRPRVVHGQGLAVEGLLATRLARRLDVPAVVTVHGMVDRAVRLSRDPARALLARRVMSQSLRRAAGVVFVSPHRKEELSRGLSADVRVIPNAVAAATFDVEGGTSSTVILHAGVIGPNKRLLDLVRALPAVRREVPEASLRVAGPRSDEGYAREVEGAVAELGLRDAVEFLGPLDARSLRREYAQAGALALVSAEENAPQVVAEAMAAGVPVVASAVGGLPWMVEDGVTGFLFPAGEVDTLARRLVAALRGDRPDVSANARRAARRFAPERVAAQTLDLYRAVCGAHR